MAPLAHIPQAPKALWMQGRLPPDRSMKTVAIVGSRRSTPYGESVAYQLASTLARHDIVVVSGMAYGIDAKAHQGCLDASGITLAVLGTAIDRIYPLRNFALSKAILEKGAILSEYGPGQDTGNWSFLERNRLVSGLADVLVVVEAASRSGTLATATFALDQGKTVFAVPGNITSPMSEGCNRLISQGALALTRFEDVLSLLLPAPAKKPKTPLVGDSPIEDAILRALQNGLQDGEEIIEQSGISVSEFNQNISLLEIKGQVSAIGANCWAISR